MKELVCVQRVELLAGHPDDVEHAVVPVQLPGQQVPIEHAVLGRFVDHEAVAGLRFLPGPQLMDVAQHDERALLVLESFDGEPAPIVLRAANTHLCARRCDPLAPSAEHAEHPVAVLRMHEREDVLDGQRQRGAR